VWPGDGLKRAPTHRIGANRWTEPQKRINQPVYLALVGETRRFGRFFRKLLDNEDGGVNGFLDLMNDPNMSAFRVMDTWTDLTSEKFRKKFKKALSNKNKKIHVNKFNESVFILEKCSAYIYIKIYLTAEARKI
jgi:hypothetical protein